MKKTAALITVLVLVATGFISCGKSEGPKAGTAKSDDMLKFFPVDADGVFFVDMSRAMEAEFIQKALTEDEDLKKFIEKTNIDPTQDIFFLAGAINQKSEEDGKEQGSIVVNMKFDKDLLLPLLKEKAAEEEQDLMESDYEGYTLYGMIQDEKEICLSFLDDSNIAMGNPGQVKSVIDVILNKKEDVFKNKALTDLISKTNKQAILWGAIQFNPETLDKVASESPMLEDLKGIQSASLSLDYKSSAYHGEIKLTGGDEAKNKQIVEFLTGIKALGAMLAGEKPEVGEVLNSIEITSDPENVLILVNIPEELLVQLQNDMKSEEENPEEEIR